MTAPLTDPRLALVLEAALAQLGLSTGRPVLVLVGGAARLDPEVAAGLATRLGHLLPRLDGGGAVVVDGGTRYGVMAAMGAARAASGAALPLLGVAAAGTVEVATCPATARLAWLPGAADDRLAGGAVLDPGHTHFLLVPGRRWGDESPWISAVATVLAGDRPSLTLVVAGGRVTALDAEQSRAAGRRLLVLGGSGGTADDLARSGAAADLDVLDLQADPGQLATWVCRRLGV